MEIKDIAKFVFNEALDTMLKARNLDKKLTEFIAEHTQEEINFIIKSVLDGSAEDYQISAW